jgi:hypothetical protein
MKTKRYYWVCYEALEGFDSAEYHWVLVDRLEGKELLRVGPFTKEQADSERVSTQRSAAIHKRRVHLYG